MGMYWISSKQSESNATPLFNEEVSNDSLPGVGVVGDGLGTTPLARIMNTP